jgi:signal transduction histidine kinase
MGASGPQLDKKQKRIYAVATMCRAAFPPFSKFFSIALGCLMVVAGSSTAQENAAPTTRVAEVVALGADQARDQAERVHLKGVVTFVTTKRDAFKIHDDEAGIGVALPPEATCPAVGDQVEVIGITTSINVQAHRYPHIQATKVVATGRRALPTPIPVSVSELASFKHYNQWVSVEGVVIMWKLNGTSLSVMLTGPDTWAVVHVRGFSPATFPTRLHGAKVRVTGVNMGITHSAADTLIAPDPSHLEVLTAGYESAFDAPERTATEVLLLQVPAAERVRVRGVISALPDPQTLNLTTGATALCVQLQHGWLRAAGSGHLYADAGRLPTLKPGDQVEVVGSVLDQNRDAPLEGYSLLSCHLRVLGHTTAPEPIDATLSDLAQGAHTHQLIKVRGRLLQKTQAPLSRNLWRSTLLIEANGTQLPVIHQAAKKLPIETLRLDDAVQVTGLVEPKTSHSERRLRIVNADDLLPLGLAPEISRQRWLFWGSLGALLIGLLALWIGSLQRSIQRQKIAETALQKLNSDLEARVSARTTELEKAQHDLKLALDQERELGELKSRFVTMVSHEFRTPLGIIMSAIELMQHYDDRLPPEQKRELTEDIHSATRLMAGLMEQVLVLGRVEAGKLGCCPNRVDLDLLAQKLTDETLSATHRQCKIEWLPEGDLTDAWADESLLRQIFGNLLSNAVKYSPPGSTVQWSARRENADVIFDVTDHGIGIPEEELPRLFEAFHRCQNVGEVPGTGLGLVIVKRCVEIHGGSLSLHSRIGEGTTFTVRLPLSAPINKV